MMLSDFAGIDIIESQHLTVAVDVKRRWRERLFSRPWRPWQAWRSIQVPDPDYYMIDGKTLLPDMAHLFEPQRVIVAHPATAEKLRRLVIKGPKQ